MKKIERRTNRAASKSVSAPAVDDSSSKNASENLTLDEIKELIEIVSVKQFHEFDLQRGSFRLRLQKGPNVAPVDPSHSPVAAAATTVVESRPEQPSIAVAVQTASTPAPAQEEIKLHVINSPIVGTFYRAPSPTAEPFVKLGDQIEAGQNLCIIEAMKLMNEIQSDASGTIAKIYVENGQPVEYGQPLFGIKV
jgi:acetyl-CoA carboxylase biotin carboxyl carrier protein